MISVKKYFKTMLEMGHQLNRS